MNKSQSQKKKDRKKSKRLKKKIRRLERLKKYNAKIAAFEADVVDSVEIITVNSDLKSEQSIKSGFNKNAFQIKPLRNNAPSSSDDQAVLKSGFNKTAWAVNE